MKSSLSIYLILLSLALANFAVWAKSEIQGIWQHTDKPASLTFDMQRGIATVYKHENNPDAEGLTVIQDIKPGTVKEQWQGQMYNGYINKYVPVTLILSTPNTLIVQDSQASTVLNLVREKQG